MSENYKQTAPKYRILMVDTNQAFIDAFSQQLAEILEVEIVLLEDFEALQSHSQRASFDVVLCSLNLVEAFNESLQTFLASIETTVVIMAQHYIEELGNLVNGLNIAEYLVQDSSGAIENAVRVVARLLKNASCPVWILSMNATHSEPKLEALLKSQRFPVRLFDSTGHLAKELGLSGTHDPFIEPVLPRLILMTGATLNNCHGLIEWMDALRKLYSSEVLPIMFCGRPSDLRVTMKLLKYGVNDFYNLHFSPEELFIRIQQNLSQ